MIRVCQHKPVKGMGTAQITQECWGTVEFLADSYPLWCCWSGWQKDRIERQIYPVNTSTACWNCREVGRWYQMPKGLVWGKELVSALWCVAGLMVPICPDCSDWLTIPKIQFTNRSPFFLGNSLTATSKEWKDTDLRWNKTEALGERKQQQPSASVHGVLWVAQSCKKKSFHICRGKGWHSGIRVVTPPPEPGWEFYTEWHLSVVFWWSVRVWFSLVLFSLTEVHAQKELRRH